MYEDENLANSNSCLTFKRLMSRKDVKGNISNSAARCRISLDGAKLDRDISTWDKYEILSKTLEFQTV